MLQGGEPENIVGLVVYLPSRAASHVNGETIGWGKFVGEGDAVGREGMASWNKEQDWTLEEICGCTS
jgi:hypothetical protein